MMDMKDLQYFLAVAQAGTITGAAAKLCMAQPPLSRQMKELEEELGTTLFIRGKRHIRLTEEGIFLRQQAEEIAAAPRKRGFPEARDVVMRSGSNQKCPSERLLQRYQL